MYAIVELGGLQWRLEPGVRFDVNRLTGEVGAKHNIEQVLLANDGSKVQIGKPYVSGAKVVCEIIEHRLGKKIITYKFKRRSNSRRKRGHRQPMTRLEVKEINA